MCIRDRVYLADTGLLHSLLGIGSEQELLAHPKCGASWEGFALHEIIRQTGSGRELAAPAELMLVRDLSTNESQALAKQHEEAQMLRDMQADIVQQIMRRLAAVTV